MAIKRKIIEILLPILINKGYSEMTISCISKAIGMQKSSIYHFFPGGKSQIGLEIILFVDDLLSQELFHCLRRGYKNPVTILHKALDILCEFYKQGNHSCVINIISTIDHEPKIKKACNNLLQKLITIFTTILMKFNLNHEEAQQKSIEIITLIQGSLIISHATNQNSFFLKQIQLIKKTVTNKWTNKIA